MSSPPPAKFQKLSQDWNSDLLHLFLSWGTVRLYLEGRPIWPWVRGCKVSNNYYSITSVWNMSGLFCRSSYAIHSFSLLSEPLFQETARGRPLQRAQNGPRRAIALENIEPEVFESAMKWGKIFCVWGSYFIHFCLMQACVQQRNSRLPKKHNICREAVQIGWQNAAWLSGRWGS